MKLAQGVPLEPIYQGFGFAAGERGEHSIQSTETIVSTVLGLLTIVGGLAFILYFTIGAINWITAEGKPDKLEKARHQIVQAITGLLFVVGAYAIAAVLGAILGLRILDVKTIIHQMYGEIRPVGTLGPP